MTINEYEAFLKWHFESWKLHCAESDTIEEARKIYDRIYQNDKPIHVAERERGYMAWKAGKAQAVPETHVIVEKSKISTWWQDADEPENIANTEDQLLEMIAESEIYIDDMLIVDKHVQANLSTQELYCVYQIINQSTGEAKIKICESKSEAEEILNNNAKWVVEKEADQYESMNAFFEEEGRKSGAEQ